MVAKSHLQASIAPLEDVQRNRPKISQSGAEGAWSAISQATTAQGPQVPLMLGQQSFSINSSADSWIEIIDGNGKKVEMDLLRAGNERNYIAMAPVKLLLGRASSIELTHNGEPVDLAPYTRGNIARITLGNTDESPTEAADAALESVPAEEPAEADTQ
jgi:cytoskeleton protein RodZ